MANPVLGGAVGRVDRRSPVGLAEVVVVGAAGGTVTGVSAGAASTGAVGVGSALPMITSASMLRGSRLGSSTWLPVTTPWGLFTLTAADSSSLGAEPVITGW